MPQGVRQKTVRTATLICGHRSEARTTNTSIVKPVVAARPHPLPPHLLDCWPQVCRRIRAAQRILLLLDFDGTLAPLRRRPEDVALSDRVRRVLRKLASHSRVRVHIISGRRRADLLRRVRVARAQCLGLHGWEEDGKRPKLGRSGDSLRKAQRLITERILGLRGIRVENKRFGLVVHYRGAPRKSVHKVEAVLQHASKCLWPRVRVLPGDEVWEILPEEIKGKGAYVRKLLAGAPDGVLPIYIGDDTSDESAFAAIRDGITVSVGRPQGTRAHYSLPNPSGVAAFLRRLEAEIRENG